VRRAIRSLALVSAKNLSFGLVLGVTLLGCKAKGSARQAASSINASSASVPPGSAQSAGHAMGGGATDECAHCVVRSSQIREDPEASKRDWNALLARQARKAKERPLRWDRRHLSEHEAVLDAIGQVRARYDGADTKPAVESARSSLQSTIADIRAQVHAIDPWHNGSALLDDYEAILQILEQRYPSALSASVEGRQGELLAVRKELDAHLKAVREWLGKAAALKDRPN
jgi:hypothetical protein